MSADSPVAILYSTDGYAVAVTPGAAIATNPRSIPVAGTDGSNSRTILTSAAGAVRIDPTGATAQPVTDNGGSLTVDGTVAATQSGTWTVQPGNTANTTPWLATISQGGNSATVTGSNALKVDGSAVTQPVSDGGGSLTVDGSVTVTQSTAANLNATVVGAGTAGSPSGGVVSIQGVASGTVVPVSDGGGSITVDGTVTANIGTTNGLALDATLAKLTITSGTALGSNTSAMVAGSVTTAAPTYTTGQINPLSLTTGGLLRVDGSGTTQPVSGTVTANAGTGTFTTQDTSSLVDNATFTDGTSRVIPSGHVFDETPGTALTENDIAASRVDSKRSQIIVLEDGYTRGVRTTIKPASTAAVATDNALVVAISPNNTVAATQSGTWTVQPGNTANTTPWLATISQGGNSATVSGAGALKVDGSAVTQPVSGTVTANIGTSGSLALDATVAKLTITSGTALGSNTSAMVAGSVTTAAPTYTTGQINPLSLTTAGALRIDGSGVTQPVSGTITANIGTAGTLALDASITAQSLVDNAAFTDGTTRVQPVAFILDETPGTTLSENDAGAARMDVKRSQIMVLEDGYTRGVRTIVKPASTAAAATDNALVVAISPNNTVGVTQSGTWTVQPGNTANTTPWLSTISQGGNSATVSASNALKVDGSAVTQPVSGTVTANIGTSGSLALDATVAKLTITSGTALGSNTSAMVAGSVTTAAPTYTTGQINPLSLTTTGALRIDGSAVTQPVSGTITANIGTAGTLALDATVAKLTIAQSTALGSNTQALVGGSVTTAAPTYTTGNINPLSLTTAGALRIDGSATTQPVSGTVAATQSGTWTVQPGNTANTTPWLATISQGGNAATVSGAGALKVDGSAVTQPVSGTITANIGTSGSLALDATLAKLTITSGTALGSNTSAMVAGSVTTAAPTYTTGQINPLSLTTSGLLRVDGSGTTQPVSGTITANIGTSGSLALDATLSALSAKLPAAATLADGASIPSTTTIGSSTLLYNGTTLDIARSGQVGVLTAVVGFQNMLPVGRFNSTRLNLSNNNYAPIAMDNQGNMWTRDGYQPVYEDNTNGVAATQTLPLAGTTYAYTTTQGIAALPGNIKSSAGNVFCISVYNANAAARFVQLFNSTAAPSGTPLMSFLLPASGQLILGTDFFGNGGFNFTTGITLGISTAAGTYTAATAGEHNYVIGYK